MMEKGKSWLQSFSVKFVVQVFDKHSAAKSLGMPHRRDAPRDPRNEDHK